MFAPFSSGENPSAKYKYLATKRREHGIRRISPRPWRQEKCSKLKAMNLGTRCTPEPTATTWRASTWHLLIGTLSLLTLCIQGYHPLAEDGGLYVAGIEWKLDPTLFPHYGEFVRAHLRFSLFAPAIAELVRLTHLSLMGVLLLVELLSLWLTFYAAWQLLRRLIPGDAAQLAGMALLGAWWTLPVAGTSLMLMDPYVTARSLTLPLSLLAMALALDDWHETSQSLYVCCGCLWIAYLCHPLMATYGLALVIVLRLLQSRHPYTAIVLVSVATLLLAAVVQHLAAPETPAIRLAEISRDYWYLERWHWYELLGLLGPLVVIALTIRTLRRHFSPAAVLLLRACLILSLLAITICLLFAREALPTHLLARLQPLRVFVLVYAMLPLILGAGLMQAALDLQARSQILRRVVQTLPGLFVVSMALTMYTVQRDSFRASQHLELPWRIGRNPNPWVQAFLWTKNNTPRDALFALDAKYVNIDGEDAQTFRATSLRSALPDYSKDGGEASITPALAATWQAASAAQKDLSAMDDATRDATIAAFGTTWMLLHAEASTRHPCPYSNSVVKVCRLTP